MFLATFALVVSNRKKTERRKENGVPRIIAKAKEALLVEASTLFR